MALSLDEVRSVAVKLHDVINDERVSCFEPVKEILCKYSKEQRKQIVDYKHKDTSALFSVGIIGCQKLLEFLLEECNADLEVKCPFQLKDDDPDDVSLLWVAAVETGNLEMVKLLVKHGADVNGCTDSKSTALRGACLNNDLSIVEYLLSCGADVNIPNVHGSTCLMNAVRNDKLVRLLIEKGASLNVKETGRGQMTALHYAIHCSELSAVKVLVEAGADLNIPDKIDKTPLRTAATFPEIEIAEYLLSLPSISPQEKIEAFQLLGASCVDSGDFDEAIEYWTVALESKETGTGILSAHGKSGRHVDKMEMTSHRVKEPVSITEWKQMRKDPETLIQLALLVKERIFSSNHEEYGWSLCEYATFKLSNGQKREAIDVNMSIFELFLSQHGLLHEEVIRAQSYCIGIALDLIYNTNISGTEADELLLQMLSFSERVDQEAETIMKSGKPKNEKSFKTLLCVILYAVKALSRLVEMTTNEEYQRRFLCFVQRLVVLDPRDQEGNSLLHLLVDKDLFVHLEIDEMVGPIVSPFEDKSFMRLLVGNGLSLNSKNNKGDTVLHTTARSASPHVEMLDEITFLLDLGAHLDAANNTGETCLSVIRKKKIDIPELKYLTLQCLTSNVIISHRISYKDIVPTLLVPFIHLHEAHINT